MKTYLLLPEFNQDGDTIFRSIGVSADDRKKWLDWMSNHQRGRDAVKNMLGTLHCEWRAPKEKPAADFPSNGNPGGIYSIKAIGAIRNVLEANGDIYSLQLEENQEAEYFLFDCWSKVEAIPNPEYNIFQPDSLRSLAIQGGVNLPDVCIADSISGLIVSERFKTAAEAAGLTGMVFYEAEVLYDKTENENANNHYQ